MAASNGTPYSYYASQTVRTLRGLLESGVNATGWSSNSTSAWAGAAARPPPAAADDTLRPGRLDESNNGMPDMPRRASGAGKKASRPGIGQLFDGPEQQARTPAPDQRHNEYGTSSRNQSSSSSRADAFQLDRVLFHVGSAADLYSLSPNKEEKLPLLALCACNLPNELTDLVVSQLVSRLDSHAQEPYMLVLFASPSNPIPVQHLIRYYRTLPPEVRRNVQRLWICHAGLFTKIAVRLFLNTVVSGKVTRKGKVKLVDSLNELGRDISLSSIVIPPEVLVYDAKTNGRLSLGRASPVFGTSLSQSMEGDKLPLPVHQAIQLLRSSTNLQTVGLFRKVPSITLLDVCKNAYDCNIPINLSDWPDSTILAASIMKNFLRNMVHPVFPSAMYECIRKCPVMEDEAVEYIRERLLPALEEEHPDGHRVIVLLEETLGLLKDVSKYQDINQMDSHNLAVVFLPVLVRSADIRQDALICTMPRKVKVSAIDDNKQKHEGNGISKTSSLGMILKLCIDRFDEVFPASHLGTAQPPGTASMGMTPKSSRTRSGSSRSSTDLSSEIERSSSNHCTVRHTTSTLRLLGSPGTVKKMNGKVSKSEASRESARGLFSRE